MSHDKSRSNRHRRSSSSSSSSEVEEIFIKKSHRKHREHSSEKCSKKKHSNKKCNESDIESYSNDKKCSETKESPKRRSSSSERRSCSSSSEHKDKCTFDEIYKYYKYRLATDNNLMVAGSDAYISGHNNVNSVIPQYYPAYINDVNVNYNVDHLYANSSYYVRKSGVYILFFIVNAEQSSQFSVWVNGIDQGLTRTGNNGGSGQLVLRCLLRLKEDDNVLVRNADSSVGAVQSNIKLGGLIDGNNMTCVLVKVAPYNPTPCSDFDEKCLSHRKKCLFKKLMDKMLCDKELMLTGFSTHASFWTTTSQTVDVESDVLWNTSGNVNNVVWDPSNSSNVVINEDGVYKLFFYANVDTAGQFAFTVNNVPQVFTIQGTNKGSTPLSVRVLLNLYKGDVITVRNHTSAGPVSFTQNTGGSEMSVSTILTIFKIAPLCKPDTCPVKISKYHRKCYELFKDYLLKQDCLQIDGSEAYNSDIGNIEQTVLNGNSFDWPLQVINNNFIHKQGTNNFVVTRDGVYDIFTDMITNEPQQIALSINGIPEPTTFSGRNSGGGRCIMRQFVKLYKGDVVKVINYNSLLGSVTTSINPGGNLPGQNIGFMTFRLSPICLPTPLCLPTPPCLPAPQNTKPNNNTKPSDKVKPADSRSKNPKV